MEAMAPEMEVMGAVATLAEDTVVAMVVDTAAAAIEISAHSSRAPLSDMYCKSEVPA
jgi:hypothetical protein